MCRCVFHYLQKLAHRRSALAGLSFADESSKSAWEGVLAVDMMSSEESAEEGDEEVYLHKPLPWRSARLTEMLKCLDIRVAINQSALSHRQRMRRIPAMNPPLGPSLPQLDILRGHLGSMHAVLYWYCCYFLM